MSSHQRKSPLAHSYQVNHSKLVYNINYASLHSRRLSGSSNEIRPSTLDRFPKRNIDEIDRTAFDNFFKRNLDEIDRVGWSGFVKRLHE